MYLYNEVYPTVIDENNDGGININAKIEWKYLRKNTSSEYKTMVCPTLEVTQCRLLHFNINRP
jgi:hypothetical protein